MFPMFPTLNITFPVVACLPTRAAYKQQQQQQQEEQQEESGLGVWMADVRTGVSSFHRPVFFVRFRRVGGCRRAGVRACVAGGGGVDGRCMMTC